MNRRRPTLFWLRWKAAFSSSSSTSAISQLLRISPSIDQLGGEDARGIENPPVFSLGQATFASRSGRSVIATAYFRSTGDRKLGIVYCTNRPSSIVRFTLPDSPIPDPQTTEKEKKSDEKSKSEETSVQCHHLYSSKPCRSPRVWFPPEDSDGAERAIAVWLSSEKEPHGSCTSLHMMELPTRSDLEARNGWESASPGDGKDDFKAKIELVVKSVWEPVTHVDKGGFPGLYIIQLPSNPFLYLDGTLHVVSPSAWGSHQTLMAIPLPIRGLQDTTHSGDEAHDHNVVRLLGPDGKDSAGLVTCNGGSTLVASFSSMTAPNELFYATLDRSSIEKPDWRKVTCIGDRGEYYSKRDWASLISYSPQ